MGKQGIKKVAGWKDLAMTTDLTYPDRPRLFQGLFSEEDVIQYRDALRDHLFWSVSDENPDWAPHNPNAPHTTRHYWTFRDHKGAERRCCRETFHEISTDDEKTFSANSIVRRVKNLVDEQMATDPQREQPPDALLRFTMAKLALAKTKLTGEFKGCSWLDAYQRVLEKKKGGKKTQGRWPFVSDLFHEALAQLWRHKERWPAIQVEYNTRDASVDAALRFINERIGNRKMFSLCEAYDRDETASQDENILGRVGSDVIYLAVDKHHVGILLRWPKCVQDFLDAGVTNKAASDVRLYHSIEPPLEPDYARSPSDVYWKEQNPRFDKANDATYPGAGRGVSYLGFGCETGHPDKPVAPKVASKKGPPEVARLRKQILEGSLDAITEVQRFLLGIMNPELLAKQQAAIRKFPVATMIPPNGAHSYTSILDCVKSDSHKDSNDAPFGYASLTPFGDFQGGDIFFRDQGVRLSFQDGDVAVFMGHEMVHGITWWTGNRRMCMVNAFHENIWRQEDWVVDENGIKGPPKKETPETKQDIPKASDSDQDPADFDNAPSDRGTSEAPEKRPLEEDPADAPNKRRKMH